MARFRILFILGRVSNLPTVWSNCIAGWWLGGGRDIHTLSPFLFAGVSLLYIAGMYLNDACDAVFDRANRRDRPIPSGAISRSAVWKWSLAWAMLGIVPLFILGTTPGVLGLILLSVVVLYNTVHRTYSWSAVLLGSCRLLVYVIAATTAPDGATGWALWGAIAMGAYVTGLSFLARREDTPGEVARWPVALLCAPVVIALAVNADGYRQPALLLCLVFGLWAVRCLRFGLWSSPPQMGRTIAGLLAGIIFADLLACADAPRLVSGIFLALFLVAIGLQRIVPAT